MRPGLIPLFLAACAAPAGAAELPQGVVPSFNRTEVAACQANSSSLILSDPPHSKGYAADCQVWKNAGQPAGRELFERVVGRLADINRLGEYTINEKTKIPALIASTISGAFALPLSFRGRMAEFSADYRWSRPGSRDPGTLKPIPPGSHRLQAGDLIRIRPFTNPVLSHWIEVLSLKETVTPIDSKHSHRKFEFTVAPASSPERKPYNAQVIDHQFTDAARLSFTVELNQKSGRLRTQVVGKNEIANTIPFDDPSGLGRSAPGLVGFHQNFAAFEWGPGQADMWQTVIANLIGPQATEDYRCGSPYSYDL